MSRAVPLSLSDVDDVEPVVLRSEVRTHLVLEVADDESQAVAAGCDDAARCELTKRVLQEGLQAYRVQALLKVRPQLPEAGAVTRRKTDEVHPGKVTPRPRRASAAAAWDGKRYSYGSSLLNGPLRRGRGGPSGMVARNRSTSPTPGWESGGWALRS